MTSLCYYRWGRGPRLLPVPSFPEVAGSTREPRGMNEQKHKQAAVFPSHKPEPWLLKGWWRGSLLHLSCGWFSVKSVVYADLYFERLLWIFFKQLCILSPCNFSFHFKEVEWGTERPWCQCGGPDSCPHLRVWSTCSVSPLCVRICQCDIWWSEMFSLRIEDL